MIRIFLFLLKAAILGLALLWVIDQSRPLITTAEIFGRTYHLKTETGWLALIVLVAVLVVWGLARTWEWLRQSSHRREKRRLHQGLESLISAQSAFLAGDEDAFQRHQGRVQKYLKSERATLLLQADMAQRKGQITEAQGFYTRALEDPALEVAALKGLESLAQYQGHIGEALHFSQRLQKRLPKSGATHITAFTLYAQQQHWDEALKTLAHLEKIKGLDKDIIHRYRATLWLEKSKAATAKKETSVARTFAAKAYGLQPAHVPAALTYANILVTEGRLRKARSVLEKNWRLNPHPEVAQYYLTVLEKDGNPLQKVKKAEQLLSLVPRNPQAHMVVAETCRVAQLWGEARKHAMEVVQEGPTASVYRFLAQLEKEEKNDDIAAARWLALAADAPEDPVWECRECDAVVSQWHALCPTCHAFDSIETLKK